ncbi:MAG: hypothetical protein OSJ62_10840 [Lachnospiraceae bacterium]|nr:hypothetical protein [Lachnospiraceae bacterium]
MGICGAWCRGRGHWISGDRKCLRRFRRRRHGRLWRNPGRGSTRRDSCMIYITGDTHGEFGRIEACKENVVVMGMV